MIPIDFGERMVDPEPDFGCADLARRWDTRIGVLVRKDLIDIQRKYSLSKQAQINPLGVRVRRKRVNVPIHWWPKVKPLKEWLLENNAPEEIKE